MYDSDSKRITRDALLALFAGLSLSACQKTEASATAEKVASSAPSAAPALSAKEVPKAAGSAEAEKGCAPGGCSPGACAGSKKKD
ncbi:MAG: hypothetical protein QM756_11415 [Polyangiaceae bacterium]